MNIDDLIAKVSEYDDREETKEKIKLSYDLASYYHRNQTRQSGEPYIIHPLSVAYILQEMHADRDTICAGLLHDTIEDTELTKEEITRLLNEDVANLVDGVTKISNLHYLSKEENDIANTQKLINGLTEDVRIIIIKLADRLHNMRTLGFKSDAKQKSISIETLEIYCPLANLLGAYKLKGELEDIALKFINPKKYDQISYEIEEIKQRDDDMLEDMLQNIHTKLNEKSIDNTLKYRIKNIYGIYQRLVEGDELRDIHDLLALKVIVKSIDECYSSLGVIHSQYKPLNALFKDYICNPKTNLYQSIHTTVFAPRENLVQMQIRTPYMDKIATYGVARYFDEYKEEAREKMQKEIRENYQFYPSLIEIKRDYEDNEGFVRQVKEELLSEKVYVINSQGVTIELPKGSTVIDFAYKIGSHIGNKTVGAYINDEIKPPFYVLHNMDRIQVITNDFASGPSEEWLKDAKTAKARRKIREFTRNKPKS